MRGTSHDARSTIPFAHKFSCTVQLDASGDQTGSLSAVSCYVQISGILKQQTGV